MRNTIIYCFIFFSLLTIAVQAQTTDTLAIRLKNGSLLFGVAAKSLPDTLHIQLQDGSTVAVPKDQVVAITTTEQFTGSTPAVEKIRLLKSSNVKSSFFDHASLRFLLGFKPSVNRETVFGLQTNYAATDYLRVGAQILTVQDMNPEPDKINYTITQFYGGGLDVETPLYRGKFTLLANANVGYGIYNFERDALTDKFKDEKSVYYAMGITAQFKLSGAAFGVALRSIHSQFRNDVGICTLIGL